MDQTQADSHIDPSADIDPSAVVHPSAKIGPGTFIGAKAVIGANVQIGAGCKIQAGSIIGAAPFVTPPPETLFPVIIEDGAEIGSLCSVQFGAKGPTRIGAGSRINHHCAIGHDVDMGAGVQVGLMTTISGHSEIGERARIGPGCNLTNRSVIGHDAIVGIGSLVLHPVDGGTTVMGRPAELRDRQVAASRRLRELLDMERPSRRVTGHGNRLAQRLPPSVKLFLKRLLGKV